MIRLYRILPLLIVLAVVAVAVYLIMSFRYSSDRAKATLIRVFFWLNAVLSVGFALITAYALLERNQAVTELFGSCLAVTLIGLAVTLVCRAVFRKNHPRYGEKVTQATIINDSLGSRFAENMKQAVKDAVKETVKPSGKRK